MPKDFREKERQVWGSNTQVEFHRAFGLEMPDVDSTGSEFRRLSSFASRGKPFNKNTLPVKHKIADVDREFSSLPEFFHFNFFYASEKIVEIFMEFDLGETLIHPVTILGLDGRESLGSFSIVATQNNKNCLLPDQSNGVRKNEFDLYEKPIVPKDDSICFDSSALSGPDIFHVDRFEGLYLSNELVDRLKTSSFAKYFHLYRVRVR